MKCAVHPDREAIGDCCSCGRYVCPECKVTIDGQIFCNQCLDAKLKGGAWPGPAPSAASCTSGLGALSQIPPEIRGWNWGGFLLTWIWGIGNNVWWSFLVFIPYLGFMVMPWVLAFKGNQWAWQSRHWDSVEHFKRAQHTWAMWGLGITIAVTLLLTIILLLGFGLFVWGMQQSGVQPF